MTSAQNTEGVILTILFVGGVLWYLVRRFGRSRPDLRVGVPVFIGFGLRLAAIAGIGLTGLGSTLRGGDETTFLAWAANLAQQPLGHGYLPHGPYQLQTVLFALEMKLGLTVGAMRILQVGIALTGVILILAAVYDLAGGRAARIAAWIIAFEPASIFFNSLLHKEPNMELASGLVIFGGTMIWKRLDLRGLLLFALAGFIAVETRSYAGWFLVSAAVMILLHASLRSMDRPMKAMPIVYAVIIAGFVVTPTLLAVSSHKSLQTLQQSQNANTSGSGQPSPGGANSDNLALEQVNFSTRGQIVTNLPRRISDLLLRPFPWQLHDTSQRFGVIGTLVAYALMLALLVYGWQSRGQIFSRAGPLVYTFLFLLVAYALAVGNAGTGFRYRTHLVTIMIGGVAILREQALEARARRRVAARSAAEVSGQPQPALEPPTQGAVA